MDCAVVFVANIPFYVYYNYSSLPNTAPRYRTLVVRDNGEVMTLTCQDAQGAEVMPYPEYILALFTYLFEVRGRYKKHMNIQCIDGVHFYAFYVDASHKYGVNVDFSKEILTYRTKTSDFTEFDVADYFGYDAIRLLNVNNLDCFSPTVLAHLRFLRSGKNCQRAVAFSHMGALRLLSDPESDLLAETLVAALLYLTKYSKNPPSSITLYPSEVRLFEGIPIYYAYSVAAISLDGTVKIPKLL